MNSQDREETLANAHSLWNERIRTIDDAFNLAPAPESSTMAMNVEATGKQSKWDAVQEAFLRFYVSALKVSFNCVNVPCFLCFTKLSIILTYSILELRIIENICRRISPQPIRHGMTINADSRQMTLSHPSVAIFSLSLKN